MSSGSSQHFNFSFSLYLQDKASITWFNIRHDNIITFYRHRNGVVPDQVSIKYPVPLFYIVYFLEVFLYVISALLYRTARKQYLVLKLIYAAHQFTAFLLLSLSRSDLSAKACLISLLLLQVCSATRNSRALPYLQT